MVIALAASQIQITPFGQRGDFAVGNRALPTSKSRNPDARNARDPVRALFPRLDDAGDLLRRLDVVHLDVHTPRPMPIRGSTSLSAYQVGGRAMGQFEHEMVGVQAVEKRNQRGPVTFLNRLSAGNCRSRNATAFSTRTASSTRLIASAASGPSAGLPGTLGLVHLHAWRNSSRSFAPRAHRRWRG